MRTPRQAPSRKTRTAAAGSWLALLAAATLGDGADTVRAEVKADGLSDDFAYRLVVQSYHSSEGPLPDSASRPIASAQRAVTADEMKHGVHMHLLELGETTRAGDERPMVVAWIEAGGPDLEFDGRTARPSPGSVYGSVRRAPSSGSVRISLNRKV